MKFQLMHFKRLPSFFVNLAKDFNDWVTPVQGSMTKYGDRTCLVSIGAFFLILLIQWCGIGGVGGEVGPQHTAFNSLFQNLCSFNAVAFFTIFSMNITMVVASCRAYRTCAMASATIALCSGISYTLASSGIHPFVVINSEDSK